MSKNSIKSGVQNVEVPEARAGQRLDNFISARLKGIPRSVVYRLIRTGQVRVNGGRARASTRLESGDKVRIPPAHIRGTESADIPDWAKRVVAKGILLERPDLLVVNKPAGMTVHAGSGLPWGLIDVVRHLRPGGPLELVHRLDRETSGCLLLARNGEVLKELGAMFRDGLIEKGYLCLLDGALQEERCTVDAPIASSERRGEKFMVVSEDGKPARTTFRQLERYGQFSYAEADLHTGRTHQIRVHAAHLGTPVAGDARYGEPSRLDWWRKRGLGRTFLHAHRLSVPLDQDDPVLVSAPLPDDLRTLLDGLLRS